MILRPQSRLPITCPTRLDRLFMELIHRLMILRSERQMHTNTLLVLLRRDPEGRLALAGPETDGLAGVFHLFGVAERGEGGDIPGYKRFKF